MHDPASLLQAQQFQLSRHLRDPEHHAPPPDIAPQRLQVYRDLFFNNIEALLAGNFPVLRSTLGDEQWRGLVREFYARHRSQTPLFAELGREFVQFLEHRQAGGTEQPTWLPELAHYERVELALQLAECELPHHDPAGDLLAAAPLVSPLAWPLAYTWPVQRIAPGAIPDAPAPTPTLLLVRRDQANEVRFSELSPLVFRLLQLLQPGTMTGSEALRMLAAEAGTLELEVFLEQGRSMLHRLRAEHTIIGTVPAA